MNEETELQDLYLETKKGGSRFVWLAAGLVVLLLLAGGGLGLALASGAIPNPIAATAQPTAVPTATPRPQPTACPEQDEGATPAPAVVTFSASPWTDGGPLDLVELDLSLPAQAHVAHEPPHGFRYWHGDLLVTRHGFAWSGPGPAELHWFLLREPGTAFPATVEVTVDGRTLALTLQAATPVTTSAVLQ